MFLSFLKKLKTLPRNVVLLGFISGFNDISSEMIYPILPIFLTQVLGASVLIVGIMEGVAEATASIFKVLFGYWSDTLQKRKPFIIAGYGGSAIGKIVIALAQSWPIIYIGKIFDRTGKGARTGARDALLLEAAEKNNKGLIFGFHRSMDSLGAVIGPVIVLVLLSTFHNNLRLILYIATIPTIIALFFFFFVKESKKKITVSKVKFSFNIKQVSPTFRIFLIGFAIFSLGNSSDTFLLLKAKSLGLNIFSVTAAYVVYNLVYTLVSTPAGAIADKIGTKKVYLIGMFIYISVYLGFAFNTNRSLVWVLFGVYGFYIALTDGVSKALGGALIPQEQAGTAYGVMYTVSSVFGLFASILGGLLWSVINPSATFIFAAVCATISFLILGKFLFITPAINQVVSTKKA